MRINWSGFSVFVVLFAVLLVDWDLKLWEQEERVIEHDVKFYYGYLPARFIFNDIKIEKSKYEYEDGKYWFWTVPSAKGKQVFKMSCGWAILNAPFFFIAHQTAQWYDYPANGFSEPYKVFLLLSSAFYMFAGLWCVRAVLIRTGFVDSVVAVVVLLLGLATNLFFYSTSGAAMSHSFSFALVAAFVYLTLRWNDERKILQLAGAGLLFGLITLVRPSNGIVIVFFLLYSILNDSRFRRWKEWIMPAVFFTLGTGLAWLPQIVYWWQVAGEYLVFSYGKEGFFWDNPEIREVLVGFRKGWWVYTPVMILVVPGLFLLRKNQRALSLPLAVVYLVNLYVVSCWWCWWYGGGLGQRAFIDTFACWSLPLAAAIRAVKGFKLPAKLCAVVIGLFLVWLNIFQTYQFEHRSLHHDAMTRKAYFMQFGKLDPVQEVESKLVYPEYEAAMEGDR